MRRRRYVACCMQGYILGLIQYTVKARRGHVVGLVKACGVSVSDAGTTGAPLSTYYSDARLCPRNYAPSYVERRLHGGTRFALWLCLVGMHGKRPRQGPDVSSSRDSPRSLARLSRGVVPGCVGCRHVGGGCSALLAAAAAYLQCPYLPVRAGRPEERRGRKRAAYC